MTTAPHPPDNTHDECETLRRTVDRLRADNQQLIEHIKNQVRIEQTLHTTQREMDEQMRTYQRLYELGQQFSATLELPAILAITTHFVLYDLNFERCLLLLPASTTSVFQVEAHAGYYDEEIAQAAAAFALPFDSPLLAPLFNESDYIICTEDQGTPEQHALGQRVGMDEYLLFRLPGGAEPAGLLLIGNTTAMARYQTRVPTSDQINDQIMLTLANLVNQVATTITNANLHQSLQQERTSLERKVEARTAELKQIQARLVRELSTPLIPLSTEVVLMPLVGSIDTTRAQQIMETLLNGIARRQAHIAIIDITGVPMADNQVATALIQTAQAARLLGTKVILTGIGPAMAQTLVHLGTPMHGIETCGSLQSAVAAALRL